MSVLKDVIPVRSSVLHPYIDDTHIECRYSHDIGRPRCCAGIWNQRKYQIRYMYGVWNIQPSWYNILQYQYWYPFDISMFSNAKSHGISPFYGYIKPKHSHKLPLATICLVSQGPKGPACPSSMACQCQMAPTTQMWATNLPHVWLGFSHHAPFLATHHLSSPHKYPRL